MLKRAADLLAGLTAGLVLALIAQPVEAQAAALADPAVAASLRHLLAADGRLQTIGWRLARANAAYCPDTAPALGLLLLDAANYRDPAAIRAALGLAGDFAIDAAADGSPAARAGLLPGQGVLAVNAEELAALPAAPAQDHARLDSLHDRIDHALGAAGSITLTLAGGRVLELAGEPTCRARFVLSAGGPNAGAAAGARGQRVRVSEAALAATADDAEAAAIVAHELAHLILGHGAQRAALRGAGQTASLRRMESEADRLAPWLMANAGFDPAGMARLAQRRHAANPLADAFAPASHGSWRARLAAIEAELAAIARQRQQQPPRSPLDWRARFALPVPEAR